LLYPEGTISVGSSVGLGLFERGLVAIARRGRYVITPAGVAALTRLTATVRPRWQ
jgi:hypothetical protein